MVKHKFLNLLTLLWLASSISMSAGVAGAAQEPAAEPGGLNKMERLGRRLFFDANLSDPPGQSCAACHDPTFAFTDTDKWQPTSEGATGGLFGRRNTPTVMYATAATDAELRFDANLRVWRGGQFWDGRAKNLEEQAKQPFLNPLEMGNRAQPDPQIAAATVVEKVRNSGYAALFRDVFGRAVLADPVRAFDAIATAIAAFERTAAFGQYSSKFDAVVAGRAKFTAQEIIGESLYNQLGCAQCHPVRAIPGPGNLPRPGTDFTYHNIGIPKNPRSRFYRMPADLNPDQGAFVDLGLGGSFPEGSEDRAAQLGKHKVPTLRNIALTAPYGHNGYFNTLKGIVEFYNSRDSRPRCRNGRGQDVSVTEEAALRRGCWPAPEVESTVDREIRGGRAMGSMGLESDDVDAIVAFLNTLTDGWHRGLRF